MLDIVIEMISGTKYTCHIDKDKYQERISNFLKFIRLYPMSIFSVSDYFEVDEKDLFVRGENIAAVVVKEEKKKRQTLNE